MSAGYGPLYFHRNKATGITADNAQLIVDISDTTTYPHEASGGVALYALKFRVKGTAGSAGDATLQIGVVEENDAGDLVDSERATNKSAGAGDLIVLLDEGTDGGTYEYEAVAVWREL